MCSFCPFNTDFSVVHIIVVLVIVSFALLYLFISVYPLFSPLFWDKNNALPLDYSLGKEFIQLVIKITLLSVLFAVFLGSKSVVIVITIRYIFCSNQYLCVFRVGWHDIDIAVAGDSKSQGGG